MVNVKWLGYSNLLTFSIPDEGYSNLMTFSTWWRLFQSFDFQHMWWRLFQSFDFQLIFFSTQNITITTQYMYMGFLLDLCYYYYHYCENGNFDCLSYKHNKYEGYSNLLTFSIPDEGYSNLLTFSIPDEDYSRNTSCTLS
jgi:hypothetical protein